MPRLRSPYLYYDRRSWEIEEQIGSLTEEATEGILPGERLIRRARERVLEPCEVESIRENQRLLVGPRLIVSVTVVFG